ncbi:ABC transporter permease [Campylobacter hepaticus]|uniref:ABC transporter permease n=1 Tax=Campylobacter hepaticus TaxID=1813019 RepID=A0A6A7JS61_9BACT|nr:ABC transporter permease [Campylobacter hepaticus]AXP09299.1 ABC transporter permease [Campylobacter hepaticus]MCZ0772957.1 ABC transporter permease [Campylobacter hepaticus]MCZ0772973.1 ABC transporter permease [Campylobacter hepaticus]MCZ0774426.1 ABC transporter permease [Campylobacter hepaticus]MCZ0775678.1 ABC transporter permease [Campylobacter hepaticus]
MSANFKLENNTLFILGTWDKTSTYKLKTQDFLTLILSKEIIFDFHSLEEIDTVGVRFFLALENDLKNKNIKTIKQGLNTRFQALFELCAKNYQRLDKNNKPHKNLNEYFINLGKSTLELLIILKKFINFTGAFFISLFSCLKHPKNFRFIAFLYHIEHSALKALPIVILTALLVGIVLAYQAAYQLAQFGANIFIVDLMGISATRELAPLIAAIVIAGRSASSYTAQIGVMKITDEIAAMNTMGFGSFEFIIIPRVMALVVAMPLIVAISDAINILGGMLVAKLSLDISFNEFLRRFKEAVALKHIIIGLIKAPIFGFLIGIIACFRGFEVKNTTQSIGIYTTKSVVNTIFWVIAFDALFSVVLTSIGI